MKVFRDIPRRDIGRHAPKPRQFRPSARPAASSRPRSYDRSRGAYSRGPRRGSNGGGSGKGVYIFVALLLIIAGIVIGNLCPKKDANHDGEK